MFSSREARARVLPFILYMAFVVLADMLARLGWEAAALRWLYPLKIAVVATALFCYRRHYTELARPGWRPGAAAAALLTGVLVLVLWVSLNAGWMRIGHSAGFDPRTGTGALDWTLVALRIGGAALVVPLMEELFWRSFLLRWLVDADFLQVDPARLKLLAVIVTVILFGFEHDLWLAGIVAGLAYTLLYMRTGSLWWPVIAHGVTNGLLGVWIVVHAEWAYW